MILVNRVGKIETKNDESELYIKIADDREDTGGFYLFTSRKIDFSSGGFDNWYETLELVERHIKSRNWKIQWLDEEKLSTLASSSPASS